jgi:hypothetical protein
MLEALGEFDCDPAAEKSTDDGLAAGEEEVFPGELRERNGFEETEEARAEQRSDGCGGDDKPAMIVGEKVAGAATRAPIDGVADGIREGFEDRVEPGVGSEDHVRTLYRCDVGPLASGWDSSANIRGMTRIEPRGGKKEIRVSFLRMIHVGRFTIQHPDLAASLLLRLPEVVDRRWRD